MEPVKKKKGKGGRPGKQVKKGAFVTARFDNTELFILRHKAQKAGLTRSEYIRQATINGLVKARMTAEEMDLVRKLVGMATNLNQLTKEFHQAGMLKTVQVFEYYRDRIDLLIKQLKDDK
jgi:hypothetical protein